MIKNSFKAILFYSIFILFFLRGVLFSKGVIAGGDWAIPYTAEQISKYSQSLYLWSNAGDLFGVHNYALGDVFLRLCLRVYSFLNISGELFTKGFLLFSFLALAVSVFYFSLKFVKLELFFSFLAGLLAITSPLVFDYSLIGWVFFVLVMSEIPLFIWFFWLSVEKERLGCSILAGLVFGIALVNSQVIVWFPLLLLPMFFFLATSVKKTFLFLKSLSVVFFVGLSMQLCWILPFLFFPSSQVAEAVSSFDSSRFEARLSFANILRVWGGLFNFQFELTYPKLLSYFSFLIPLLAFLAVFLKRKNKKIIYLALITFLPIVLYTIRDFIYKLPFSNVFRDISRMTIFLPVPYAVLTAVSLEGLYRKKKFWRKPLLLLLLTGLSLATLPFWTGRMTGKDNFGYDVRLRTFVPPKSYSEADRFLLEDETDNKVMFIPAGVYLGILNNGDFFGSFKELSDFFGDYSAKEGTFAFSDKVKGPSMDYGKDILDALKKGEIDKVATFLRFTNINGFVVRRSTYGYGGVSADFERNILKLPGIKKTFEGQEIAVYQYPRTNFLPHFYIADYKAYGGGSLNNVFDFVEKNISFSKKPVIYGNENLGEEKDIILGYTLSSEERQRNLLTETEMMAADEMVIYPDVYIEPKTFFYQIERLEENWEKWKSKSDSHQLFEKRLMFSLKRVSEIKKYGWNREQLNFYRDEMENCLKILEKLNSQKDERFLKMLIKFKKVFVDSKEKIYSLITENQGKEILPYFSSLEKLIHKLEPNYQDLDFSPVFDIPKDGLYQVYFKSEKNEWETTEKKYFKKGFSKVSIPINTESKNLVGDNLIVKDYSPDIFYRVDFDYKVENGTTGSLIIYEDSGNVAFEKILSETRGDIVAFKAFFISSSVGEKAVIKLNVKEEQNLSLKKISAPEAVLKYVSDENSSSKNRPRISFVKVNSTKYKIKVEGAVEPYDLVFSESFHQGWKVYFAKRDNPQFSISNFEPKEVENYIFRVLGKLGNKVSNLFLKDKGYGEETASYFGGEIKEGVHRTTFLEPATFETWGAKPIVESSHFLANGYANLWHITPGDTNNEEDYQLVVEFKPQQYFYLGFFISLAVIAISFFYLIIDRFGLKS